MHKIAYVKHWDMHTSSLGGSLPMSVAFKVAFLDITIKHIRQARLVKHFWINLD